jgi:hypothetical protein
MGTVLQSILLLFHGSEVATLTWVAPWTQNLLQCGAIQYVELDTSFYALRPHVLIGLILAPTEREESYRLFDEAMTSVHLGRDEGQTLSACCRGHEDEHCFCFRHRLELLGSNPYVATLAQQLLFAGSEDGYRQVKTVMIIDFRIGCQEKAITSNGARFLASLCTATT